MIIAVTSAELQRNLRSLDSFKGKRIGNISNVSADPIKESASGAGVAFVGDAGPFKEPQRSEADRLAPNGTIYESSHLEERLVGAGLAGWNPAQVEP